MNAPRAPSTVQRILVATDFGVASERALELATDLAEKLGARLTLTHVMIPIAYPYLMPQPIWVRVTNERRLEALARGLRARGLQVDASVLDGEPWREIIDAATEGNADLVVVGTHGYRGVEHILLGSTAEKVVRTSRVPVLTVTPWYFDDVADAARQLAHGMKHVPEDAVIVGVGTRSAAIAVELAHLRHAPVDVLLLAPIVADETKIGLLAEDETWLVDASRESAALARSHLLSRLLVRARAAVSEQTAVVRAQLPRLALRGRRVVLVCDRASTSLPLGVAIAAARQGGATHVYAALPICNRATRERAEVMSDEVIAPVVLDDHSAAHEPYRHQHALSLEAIAKKMLHARRTEEARPRDVASAE